MSNVTQCARYVVLSASFSGLKRKIGAERCRETESRTDASDPRMQTKRGSPVPRGRSDSLGGDNGKHFF